MTRVDWKTGVAEVARQKKSVEVEHRAVGGLAVDVGKLGVAVPRHFHGGMDLYVAFLSQVLFGVGDGAGWVGHRRYWRVGRWKFGRRALCARLHPDKMSSIDEVEHAINDFQTVQGA